MSKIDDKKGQTEQSGVYFYKICRNCGAAAHIDNLHCSKCGKRLKEPGGIETFYKTPVKPDARRMNLDHPDGCPACGAGCGYCFSFGAKEKHPKTYCGDCGRVRKDCCGRAAKLPGVPDILPEMTVKQAIAALWGKTEEHKIMNEEFTEMLGEKMRECWRHSKEMAELFERRGA